MRVGEGLMTELEKMSSFIYLVVNDTEPGCCDYTLACFVLKVKVKVKLLTSLPGFFRPLDFPGKSTGVGGHFLLQGIFPTQGSNPGLPICRQTLYPLSHHECLK